MRNDEKSLAQQRRKMRAQHDADCRARVVAVHTRRMLEIGTRLFPLDTGLAGRVRVEAEAWCKAHPDPGATSVQAATHEAAHILAAAKLGLNPAFAEVHGTSGNALGYGGSASAWNRPLAPDVRGGYTADDAEREAVFALAGPIAEWLLAGGDLYSSPSEVLEASMCAMRSADMRGADRTVTLDRVFTLAAQIVLTFRDQIKQIAGVLERKRKIRPDTRGVAKALTSIGSTGLTGLRPLDPDEDKLLGEMIFRAPVDLARFTEEVGR